MGEESLSRANPDDRARVFTTTHWSMVLAAGDSKSPRAEEALERLCRAYWYPLYAYVRRKGHGSDDAQDLTQEFFARLLARNYLSVADRNRGKFRSFAHELTAEKIFDRRWATTLLDQAMARLREECVGNHKGKLFSKVEGFLSGEKGEASYADIAAALGMSEGAIKVAVHRMRQRYGELVRDEIAQTVATIEEADEELQCLFAVLRD